jgi:hypothetical protein
MTDKWDQSMIVFPSACQKARDQLSAIGEIALDFDEFEQTIKIIVNVGDKPALILIFAMGKNGNLVLSLNGKKIVAGLPKVGDEDAADLIASVIVAQAQKHLATL